MAFVKDVVKANLDIYNLIKEGSASLTEYYSLEKEKRGAGGDRSLLIDIKAEEIFVSYLKKYGKIFSEESGEIGEGDYEIILDPIDGSSNLASSFPYYGTSVSIVKDKKPIVSVVTNLCNGDYIFRDETGLYFANFIDGTTRDLKVKEESSLMGIFERSYVDSKATKKIQRLGMKFRSPGAIALSLAYAYSVNFVIFNGVHREYDIIAGLHICEDLNIHLKDDLIIVSKDREIFERIKEILV